MGFTVLVVDDQPDSVALVCEALAPKGHRCTGVTDPLRAVELMRAGDYEILVADWQMPVINGIEIFQWLRSLGRVVGCILMTGHAHELFYQVPPSERELVHLLPKPFGAEKLEEFVNTVGELVRLRRGIQSLKGDS